MQCLLYGGPEYSEKSFKNQKKLRAELVAKAKKLNSKNLVAPRLVGDVYYSDRSNDKKVEENLQEIIDELDGRPDKSPNHLAPRQCLPQKNTDSATKVNILKVIRSNLHSIRYCHEEALAHRPNSKWVYKIEVSIGEDGCARSIRTIKDDAKDERFGRCIESSWLHE